MQEMAWLVIIASVFSAWTPGNSCALISDSYKVLLVKKLPNNMFYACVEQIINRVLQTLGVFEKKAVQLIWSREEC